MYKDNNEELFPIVDEEGNTIGKIKRGKAHDGTKILHPVVHLHVFNSKGELSGEFAFGGAGAQAKLLEAEGIEVKDGKVDLEKYIWNG